MDDIKMKIISVSIDPEGKEWVENEAKMHGMNRSEFVRALIDIYKEWKSNGGEL